MEPFKDFPMLDIFFVITVAKMSLESMVPCETSGGRLKKRAIMATLESSGDCLGYPGKI